MHKSRYVSANRRRVQLLRVLAPDGRCARCRKRPRQLGRLEIDHVLGCTWSPRLLSSHCRVARYWREHAAGVPLRALCRTCNGSDGWYRRRRRHR